MALCHVRATPWDSEHKPLGPEEPQGAEHCVTADVVRVL